MKKDMFNKSVATNSVQTRAGDASGALAEAFARADALCDKQDQTLNQILSVARLAGHALYSQADLSGNKVAEDAYQALVLIVKLAADSIQSLDVDRASIEEARFRPAA